MRERAPPASRRACRRRARARRSEEHTSELQSHLNLVCRLLLEKKKQKDYEILQEHHDCDVLRLARGELRSVKDMKQILVDVANTPNIIRANCNIIIRATDLDT